MMNYLIISAAASSLQQQQVRVLIEDSNQRRSNVFTIPIGEDVDVYVQANWYELWLNGMTADDDLWLKHEEKQFDDLYQAVIRAGVRAARQEGATLTSVSDAMEDLITVSAKSQHLSQLQALASAATAAQRDRFFLLCAFLFLSKTLGED